MPALKLSEGAEFIIDRLEKNGYKAYAVGGCVRDLLRGKTPCDFDIASSASPFRVLELFADTPTFETGLKHGTVTVVVDGENYEVTTFRRDGEYSDGRRPDGVTFTDDLTEDLARRDFTVNAMAYNYSDGLIDPFGGLDDLKSRTLKCVGDPYKRFKEDSLRILRLVRFSSSLGFVADKKTAEAAKELRSGLSHVSAERVFVELDKTLHGENAVNALLGFHDIIFEVLPELKPCYKFDQKSPWHRYDVYEHIVRSVGAADNVEEIKWCMLLHDIGKPDCYVFRNGSGHFYGHAEVSVKKAEAIFDRLKVSRKLKRYALFLIKNHDYVISPDDKSVKKVIAKWGYGAFYDILKVKKADNAAQATEAAEKESGVTDELKRIADKIKARGDCVCLKDLAINGDDLLELGVEKEKISKILNFTLSKVISGTLKNDKEILLKYISKSV